MNSLGGGAEGVCKAFCTSPVRLASWRSICSTRIRCWTSSLCAFNLQLSTLHQIIKGIKARRSYNSVYRETKLFASFKKWFHLSQWIYKYTLRCLTKLNIFLEIVSISFLHLIFLACASVKISTEILSFTFNTIWCSIEKCRLN